MPSESRPNIVRFPGPEVSKIEINKQRAALKGLAWKHIDTISVAQLKILFASITNLEIFLSIPTVKNSKEIVGPSSFHSGSKYRKKELIMMLGGMINVMPVKRVQEILAEPNDFIRLLTEGAFPVSRLEKIDTNREQYPALDKINEIAMNNWTNFKNWENPEALDRLVCEIFNSEGISVKVEPFRPGYMKHSKDFIVISERKYDREKGIVVPRPGVVLDTVMTADLFLGSKPGIKALPANVKFFPEAQSEFKDRKFIDTYWKIIKYGELNS